VRQVFIGWIERMVDLKLVVPFINKLHNSYNRYELNDRRFIKDFLEHDLLDGMSISFCVRLEMQ
jgi:hypothetical protein